MRIIDSVLGALRFAWSARNVIAFLCSAAVFGWSVRVLASYVADSVTSYAGPTPMALDTALSLFLLGLAGMILSGYTIKDNGE